MTLDTAIATRGLTKRYRDVLAVDGLDLDVRRGEVYGFLGRNGAGKTTTIRLLLGLVRPSAGDVTVLGRRIVPGETDVFARIGYLVESASAYPNLTVRENLHIQSRLTGSPQAAVAEAIALLNLEPYVDRRAGNLSLGNKQRLSLARALLHAPALLVLDEPANALDPAGIVEVRELLRALATEQGVTVFMSSHILAEVTQLADRIGIVHDGRLIEELDRAELAAKARAFVDLRVDDSDRAAALLAGAGYVNTEPVPDGGLRLLDVTAADTPAIARLLMGAGLELIALTPSHEDLEAHFLRLTGDAVTFAVVVATEILKLRRGKVTWATLGAISMAPFAIALFMWIVREPGRAAQLGLLGTKANLPGLEATWPSCLSMLTLAVGVGGMLLLAFIVAYVFGREYADGTAKNLLALPVGRHWIVLAKLVVAAVWWLVLVVAVLAEMFVLGFALDLPGFSVALALGAVGDVVLVAVAAFLLAPPIAWITVVGRGYLPPLGFAIVTLALGDVFSHTGWAAWFPWAVVALFVGAVGNRQTEIAPGSVAVVVLVFLLGIAATIAQLRYADNVQ